MSRKEATITTNTKLTLDEVCEWLSSLPGWQSDFKIDRNNHRCVFYSEDGLVTAIVVDVGNHRPGTAAVATEFLGSPSTIVFDLAISRKANAIGRLDDIYKVAIEFLKHCDCNFLFSLDDSNIDVISRRDGTCFVNPWEFETASLAALLTFPYEFKS